MTDIQLPLHHSHQKGMNGKYSAKNTLEIRGFSGNNNTSQIANESSKLSTSSTLGSATKRSLKLIEKATPSNHNFQVLRISSGINQADFGSFAVFDTTTATAAANNPTTAMSQSISSSRSRKNSNNTNTSNNSRNTDYNTESILNFTSAASSNSNNQARASNATSNQTFATPNYNSTYINRSHTNNSTINWNEESNSGWTGTGVMSDRSSVYSIDDGDFDREASRRVNNQLREIESILYEQNSAHSKNSITECNEWLEKFPHIRVLGKQMLTSRSESDSQSSLENLRSSLHSSLRNLTSTAGSISGKSDSSSSSSKTTIVDNLNIHESNTINTSTADTTNHSSQVDSQSVAKTNNTNSTKYFRRREASDINSQNLNLYGTKLPIRRIEDETNSANNDTQTNNIDNIIDLSSFEEEIFEQEGLYEELLAYDNQEEEILFVQNKRLNLNKRRRHGLPPITPKAAMKDLVLHFLFDNMWSELIDWIADTIKIYARATSESFMSAETCKQVQSLVSGSSASGDLSLDKIIFNKSKTDLLPSISSPTYGNSSSSLLATETNSSLNLPSSTANVAKTNIVQLKLFDQYLENTKNQQGFSASLSRDNSTLYAQPKMSSDNGDMLGDLLTKDLLQIRQLNRNGSSNNSTKALNPIVTPQLRVGSGTRRQYQNNYYRKRFSSIEMSSSQLGNVEKSMIINGAGLVKPTSLLTDIEQKNVNTSSALSNSLFPLSNGNPSIFSTNTRVANSSIQAYNEENIYENDDNDYHHFQNHIIDENAIDEINLLNNNFNKSYYHNNNSGHTNPYNHLYNYFGHHNHQGNHSAGFKTLPPIENSLTSKPIRISSANNTKQTKEKNERPMTSTSTRFDLTGSSNNRRSTTPMGTVNKGITTSKKVNFVKPEDSIYANNSFLSAKAFNSLVTTNTNLPTNPSSSIAITNGNNNSTNNNNNNNSNTAGSVSNTQAQSYSSGRRNSFTRVIR